MQTLGYSLAPVEERKPVKVSVRGWLAMATGLNLAFAICVLVCKPPWPHGLSWPGRFRAATVYIALSCVAGAFGIWLAMPRRSGGEFRVLMRGALRGWVFLPSIALLLQRQSFFAQVIASAAAILMAVYLFPFTDEGALAGDVEEHRRGELFETEVPIGSSSWTPFCISLLGAAAVAVAVAGRMMLATLLLATAIYLLSLGVANVLKKIEQTGDKQDRAERIHILITVAFLCVLFGLSNPAVLQNPLFARFGILAAPKAPVTKALTTSTGYQTIVLWPLEKAKKTVLHFPTKSKAPGSGSSEPLVIPFYGPYWYFKFQGETPGANARSSKGDPLKVNVHSTDERPLLMEAHQRLVEPIETARCEEIQVVVTNDASLGAFAVGVTLTDSGWKGKASLNLGTQNASAPTSGQAEETLTFSFPKRSALKRFDSITVTFLPDAHHATSGRKAAVEKFVVIPR
jgi:hypothetical protein